MKRCDSDSLTSQLCLCHPALPAGVLRAPVTCLLSSGAGCAELLRHLSVTEVDGEETTKLGNAFFVKEGLSLTANLLVLLHD